MTILAPPCSKPDSIVPCKTWLPTALQARVELGLAAALRPKIILIARLVKIVISRCMYVQPAPVLIRILLTDFIIEHTHLFSCLAATISVISKI